MKTLMRSGWPSATWAFLSSSCSSFSTWRWNLCSHFRACNARSRRSSVAPSVYLLRAQRLLCSCRQLNRWLSASFHRAPTRPSIFNCTSVCTRRWLRSQAALESNKPWEVSAIQAKMPSAPSWKSASSAASWAVEESSTSLLATCSATRASMPSAPDEVSASSSAGRMANVVAPLAAVLLDTHGHLARPTQVEEAGGHAPALRPCADQTQQRHRSLKPAAHCWPSLGAVISLPRRSLGPPGC
mmetsp:Transcript_97546/g.252436  ORF Transcript_97546/g.252436 Transcript_97546/m.252436 type:complete len:242 (+) Transcript_97546:596-1321(+)